MSYPHRHSNPANIVANDRTFFVTSCIWGRRSLLQSERSATLFLQMLCDYRAAGKSRLHAFVVMPDHFHLLLTVGSGMTIERAVQLVKGGFAFRAGKELGFRAPVWQKGFPEVRVLDAESFENQQNYIHNNPVRPKLSHKVEEYPYSSAGRPSEIDPPPACLAGAAPKRRLKKDNHTARLKARLDTNPLVPLHIFRGKNSVFPVHFCIPFWVKRVYRTQSSSITPPISGAVLQCKAAHGSFEGGA
jgi:putative transposase